jgi:PAS domain S-box-containing protein
LEKNKKTYDGLLNALLKNCSDGIFISDKEYNTIAYSETYRKFLGATHEEMESKTILNFFDEGYLSELPVVKVIENKKPYSSMIKYYKTGKEILATGVPVIIDKKIKYVILSFRDLTKLKKLEKELHSTKTIVNKYKNELEKIKNFNMKYMKHGFVYRSKFMKELIEKIEILSRHDSNVLISGDTGVGKGMVAESIHNLSERFNKGSFIKINCGSIPENLIESELFGYEKGAFSGAKNEGKIGIIELANNGTLFLDEIGEMPLNLQTKLLDVIEDRRIKKIGGVTYKSIDIRIISATNRNLKEDIKKNLFRKDLYYRLNVIPIYIEPLANRREDIIPLFKYYETKFRKKYGIKKELSSNIYEKILDYDWSGNVRELINFTERVLLLEENLVIKNLDPDKRKNNAKKINNISTNSSEQTLKQYMYEVEKNYIINVINSTKTIKESAIRLDIDPSTLTRKMKKYSISKKFTD